MSFYFVGKGPFSKSLLLRALLVQSYFPTLKITGVSECDDVLSLKSGLKSLKSHTTINCRQGGTVLRFLALRASREKGDFTLTGSPSLFSRPLKELQMILNQVACKTSLKGNQMILKSQGWFLSGDALTLSASRSSQFASSVFLNSWNLDRDLFISIEGDMVSYSYLQMTLSFLRSLGMQIEGDNREYLIPAHQKISQYLYEPEPDMSCLFALAAEALAGGEVVFTDWPRESSQPDFIFPSVLKDMGFQISSEKNTLKVTAIKNTLKPIKLNLKNFPDMFPVLSALCATANGVSHLYGAPHLLYKESNRIQQTAELLRKAGRTVKILKDGLIIKGKPGFSGEKKPLIFFDPKEDHRMAMACSVLQRAGLPIQTLHPEVVNKSFPDFWSIVKA